MNNYKKNKVGYTAILLVNKTLTGRVVLNLLQYPLDLACGVVFNAVLQYVKELMFFIEW